MSKLRNISVGKYGLVIALLIVTVFFGVASNGKLFNAMNVSNIFIQNAYLVIISTAMFFCLSAGCVDLSVGSFILYSGAIIGNMVITRRMPLLPSLVILFISALILGILQGISIAYLNVAPFIATLAFELIIRGLAITISGGQTLGPFPKSLQFLGGAFLPRPFSVFSLDGLCVIFFIAFVVAIVISEVRTRRKRRRYGFTVTAARLTVAKIASLSAIVGFVLLRFSQHYGMPFPIIILIALVLVYLYVSNNTAFGRYVFAVGSNRNAARLSGVNDKKVILAVFINSAMLSTFAGLVVAGRLNAATMTAGVGNELEAIVSVSIGGGSRGGIFGTFCGAAIMAIVINGMNVLGLGADVQKIVKGSILLAAVIFDIYSKKRSSK